MVRCRPFMSASRVIRAVAAAELPLVLALAPALLFPTPARMLVLLAVPAIWACARRTSGHAIPPTPFNSALLLLLVMLVVSLGATADLLFSLGKVAGVALGVLVFWAVARWVTTPWRFSVATAAFIACGSLLAIAGLLGTNWFGKFPVFAEVLVHMPRAIRGVPGAEKGFQPNGVAGCLVLFLPLQIALLTRRGGTIFHPLHTTKNGRIALVVFEWTAILSTALALLLTQSRGAWIGIALAGTAFLAWYGWRSRALLAAIVAGVAAWIVAAGPSQFAHAAIGRSGANMAQNVTGRLEVWSRALYAIADFPLTGVGMNSFRRVMPALYPTFMLPPDTDVTHAHNQLLQAALDLGIPGLIAYLALWLIAGALLVAVYRRAADPACRVVAGGLGAGLIAQFAFGMTDAIGLGSKPGVLFWMMLALVACLHRLALNIQPTPSREKIQSAASPSDRTTASGRPGERSA